MTPSGRPFLLVMLFYVWIVFEASAQCANGSEPECECATAPVLCTIDELDGYAFSMTSYQHPQDAPTPLCPPPEGANTVPNNPTWFAFIAWCTSLTLDVHVNNCQPFQGGVIGAQIAIYSNCNPYTNVACDANSSDCGDNLRTISMNNLVIGNVYYFMIDGCLGSFCDVEIDVVGVCGEEMIDEWTEPIDGPSEICVGDSETFSVENLDGATDFHWYVNGVLISEGPDMTTFSYLWSTAGSFEICVDASNDPCIPESDPPLPLCTTVNVYAAGAGMITATPTPVCPNDIVNISVLDYESASGYEQYIVIVDASGTIVAIHQGDATTFTYNACGAFTAYSYNYHTSGNNSPPEIGDPFSSIACGDGCCDSDDAPFEFIDSEAPVLLNPPPSIALSCFDLLPAMTDLTWTDNCDGSGMVQGVQSGNADLCDGGVLMRTWEYEDQCGNSVTHVQTITISPSPPPQFINPPADLTVDCNNIPASGVDLSVMNTGTGQCAVSAVVSPTQNGTPDICGGSYSYAWEFSDACGHTIAHVQTITVVGMAEPVFINPPSDITVDCANIPLSAPDLMYSNGGVTPCNIAGAVPAMAVGAPDMCGGSYAYRWTYTDQCGRTIETEQNITVIPVPPPVFDAMPADLTVTCDAVPLSYPNLNFNNGESGTCQISGIVVPVVSENYNICGGSVTVTWQFTDFCSRQIQHVQNITVLPVPAAQWVSPPADITLDCDMIPGAIPTLSYTNGMNGSCAITGSVPGVQTQYDLCNGIVVWEWQFTDACGTTLSHIQTLTINPPPPVTFANPPADVTVDCNGPGSNVPPLSYSNGMTGPCAVSGVANGMQSGNWMLCGGVVQRQWVAMDLCGNLYTHIQNITVLPAPVPAFVNVPADITISCNQVPIIPPPLNYTNGVSGACAQGGTVQGTIQGNYGACGGNLVYVWQATEICGNILTASQNVTVLPANPPVINTTPLPQGPTIACDMVNSIPLNLTFSNGQGGNCAIAGSVNAAISGSYDACGGMLTYLWNTTDQCGNLITYSQSWEVLPAPPPMWSDLPADTVLDCMGVYLPPEDLIIENGQIGPCEISEVVSAEVIYENQVYTHTWTFVHPCTQEVSVHEQHVMVPPTPEISLSPTTVVLCYGDFFDLATIAVTEVNNDPITVTIHTDSPAEPGNQLNTTQWVAESDIVLYFLATNAFGCTAEAEFEIFVEPLPEAGDDAAEVICNTEYVDLTDFLSFDADPGGYWNDLDGAGVDLDNPTSVSFNNVEPGDYRFQYVVQINDCPADSAIITLSLFGPPEYIIDSVFCTNSNTLYTVIILGVNLVIDPSHGVVTSIPGGIQIDQIPIGQQLVVDIWDADIQCVGTFTVNAPNCDCPSVPAPVSLGNQQVCFGQPIPVLTVMVAPGTIANWYDAASGGSLLAGDVLMYTPSVSAVGTYTYFVEAESIEFPGCVSSTRTPVTLTILGLPVANNLEVAFCDTLNSGMLAIDLSLYKPDITINQSNVLTFHVSPADANTGNNAVALPWTALLGTNILYARVVNASGCIGVSQIQVDLNALPQYTIVTTPESCIGSGDGTIEVLGLDPTGFWTISLMGSAYGNQYLFEDIPAGTYPIRILNSITGCFQWDTVTVEPGGQVSIGTPILSCNDNGTDTDPADDFYSISVTVSTTGSGTIYELFANGSSQGFFMYGQMAAFNWPADGSNATLIVADAATGCADTLITATLNPCSSSCDLLIETFQQTCSDNGTPLDPSDDFHSIVLTVSAVNGSPLNQYGVYINGVLTYLFDYGVLQSFALPSGVTPVVQLQDVTDPACFVNLNLQPLLSCSNQCDIPVPDIQYTCDDNGTAEDPSDDFYTVVFTINVINPGPTAFGIVLVDGLVVTSAANGTEVTLGLPADGMAHLIEIQDQDDPTCSVSLTSIAFQPCSSQCVITVDNASLNCDDNDTPTDPSDDFYTVIWDATAVFGSVSGQYNVVLDGSAVATGTYGVTESLLIPADGAVHVLTLVDQEEVTCTANVLFITLSPCSNDCVLDAQVVEVYCFNNNTNQTDADDVFFIVVNVSGVNVSSGLWELAGTAITGTLGIRDTVGPYLISDGQQALGFSGVGADCTDSILIAPPASCSMCVQTIDAGPDQVLDCGTPTVTLSGQSSEPGSAIWTDPSGGQNPGLSVVISLPGQYLLTVTYPDGCTFTDTVQVTADPTLPAVWGGPDMILNCEIGDVLLKAEVLVGAGIIQYEWTDAAGNVIGTERDLAVVAAGTYFIRIYDPNVDCWSGKDAVVVTDLSNQPSAVIYADPGNIISCVIDAIVLSTDNEPNVIYRWLFLGDATVDSVFQVTQGGWIHLIALDTISLCTSRDSIEIEDLGSYPQIQIQPPAQLSCFGPTVALDASASIPAFGMFTWTNLFGDTIGMTPMVDVTTGGTYFLTLTDPANGCTASDTINVVDISMYPEIVDGPDLVLPCDMEAGSLEVSLATPVAGAVFQWSASGGQIVGDATNSVVQVMGIGTYYVEVTDPASGCSDRDTILVTQVMNAPEGVELLVSPASCIAVGDGTISFGMIEGGTPPYRFFLNGIEILESTVENLPAGAYQIEIEDALGCAFDTLIVIPADEDVVIELEPFVNITKGESYVLEAIVNIPGTQIGSVLWTPAIYLTCDTCLVTSAMPGTNITYTVVVTDEAGCTGEATVQFRVKDDTQIFIPNVISPGNHDRVNDNFTVYSNNPDTRIHALRIFDRWGALVWSRDEVFMPNDPALGWDGMMKGKPVNPAVFVYMAEIEVTPGLIRVFSGDVTVVR